MDGSDAAQRPTRADAIAARADARPALAVRCPLCAAADLVARHCKLLCSNCGYVESCEDIFPARCYPPSAPED